jgi:hypothetical protein
MLTLTFSTNSGIRCLRAADSYPLLLTTVKPSKHPLYPPAIGFERGVQTNLH